MYSAPVFTDRVIAPTTFFKTYPAPSPDGVPVLPITLFPEMIGAVQPHNGPRRIRIRTVCANHHEVPPILCGYLCAVDKDGELVRGQPIIGGQDVLVDAPAGVVIEKNDTSPFEIGFEIDGFSASAQQSA